MPPNKFRNSKLIVSFVTIAINVEFVFIDYVISTLYPEGNEMEELREVSCKLGQHPWIFL